jgi:hypothetical protein
MKKLLLIPLAPLAFACGTAQAIIYQSFLWYNKKTGKSIRIFSDVHAYGFSKAEGDIDQDDRIDQGQLLESVGTCESAKKQQQDIADYAKQYNMHVLVEDSLDYITRKYYPELQNPKHHAHEKLTEQYYARVLEEDGPETLLLLVPRLDMQVISATNIECRGKNGIPPHLKKEIESYDDGEALNEYYVALKKHTEHLLSPESQDDHYYFNAHLVHTIHTKLMDPSINNIAVVMGGGHHGMIRPALVCKGFKIVDGNMNPVLMDLLENAETESEIIVKKSLWDATDLSREDNKWAAAVQLTNPLDISTLIESDKKWLAQQRLGTPKKDTSSSSPKLETDKTLRAKL